MRLLLDTHVFLWYITGDSRLPTAFRNAIQDPANEIYLSAASVWEAVIKHDLGKLTFPKPPAEYLPEHRESHKIASLPIEEAALKYLAGLPLHHRDPFDRMLVAQGLQCGLTLATVDPIFKSYAIPLLAIA